MTTGATLADVQEKRTWQDEVIYFMLTDRFYDGDPDNNTPAGAAKDLHDPTQQDLSRYHGGDFRGIEIALENNYFNNLGITAIWITPPVKNVWNTSYDMGDKGKTGYHGYWTQDYMDIDPHLTSAKKMDGTPYPEGIDGRMAHYRDLVNLAHRKGIRIIQDVVCNHAGPVFYYDSNNNGQFDRHGRSEWIAPFKEEGFHANTRWAKLPEWNIDRTGPIGPVKVFGKSFPFTGILGRMETYGRKGFDGDSLGKSDGEEVLCDFYSLRDFWTDPSAEHYDELVDEFVRIYAFYIEEIGVDGLRIDTIKHVHHQFWADFTSRLRKKLGKKAKDVILFGEAYDGAPEVLGKYTYSPDGKQVAIDGMLNFQMCWSMRNYLRHNGNHFGHANGIERAMRDLHGTPEGGTLPYYNESPGPDGLNSRQKSITFIENHDGINRFRVDQMTARRNILANAMVLTLEGIPCLYYGTESGLHDTDGKIGPDTESGRMTFIRTSEGGRVKQIQSSESFRAIRSMIRARAHLPALRRGLTAPLWVDSRESTDDDGTFLYARYIPGKPSDTVLVGFNLSQSDCTLNPALISPEQRALVPEGTVFERIPLSGIDPKGTKSEFAQVTAGERVHLPLKADSVSLWRVKTQVAESKGQ
ncbi:MAG: alpha-amylase family glycosyl hydrolase [Akkermansiaceae bacterium]